jgi:serine-type D-Ala-D-Ala carboxypeptidase (penicillin-binding protein 5/6)
MQKLLVLAILCGLFCASAQAIETTAKNAVVIDHATGIVLYDKGANEQIYPASMTKMMTAYMMFDALKSGKIKLDEFYSVSENAWRKGGSKMFVQLGAQVAISDLMRGIIIQSGNDGCIVFAEGLAGSEERFAELMTEKGKEIGLKNSVFKNATGWPDEQHKTTVYDLAWLAKRTFQDFPEYYPVYSEKEYVYNDIRQYNRNLLLNRNMGIDGLKTGHTEEAGYGITISGEQAGRRVHVVVAGLASEKERAEEAAKLYRYGLNEYKYATLVGKLIGNVPLWYGEAQTVQAVVEDAAKLLVPDLQKRNSNLQLTYESNLQAPIKQGQLIGALIVNIDGVSEQRLPLYAAHDVAQAGFVSRAITNLKQLIN